MLRHAEPKRRRDPVHGEFGRGDGQGSSIPGDEASPNQLRYLVFLQNQLPLQQRSKLEEQHASST